MDISDHLVPRATPITTLGAGSTITPTQLVVHYTAGSTLNGAVNALQSNRASYNVLIDVDGSFHQARALNRRSGHAGRSNWKTDSNLTNSTSLNASSISISLVNLGLHGYYNGGRWWYNSSGGSYSGPNVSDSEANKLASIYNPGNLQHWAPYTTEQRIACRELISAIVDAYPSITEIVGHDDVAINYKFDPGPDLPLAAWRKEFGKEGPLGFEAKVNSPDDTLNVRDRPYYMGGKVVHTLQQGDTVFIRSFAYVSGRSGAALVNISRGRALSGWASVDIDGSNQHAGFVYAGFLTDTPLHADYKAKLMVGGS